MRAYGANWHLGFGSLGFGSLGFGSLGFGSLGFGSLGSGSSGAGGGFGWSWWIWLALAFGCSQAPLPGIPSEVTVTPRGHQEATIRGDGSLVPRWVGSQQPVGFCLDSPLSRDSSQWRAQIHFNGHPAVGEGGSEPAFRGPSARAGSVLCFYQQLPKSLPPSDSLEICATVIDEFDQSRFRIPCIAAQWEPDDSHFAALLGRGQSLIGRGDELEEKEYLGQLEGLAQEAEEGSFPFLALRLRLVIIEALRRRGDESARAEIHRRLASLPEWLAQPEAAAQASRVLYERAAGEATMGRHRVAWRLLHQAERTARSVAARVRLAIVMKQAEVLHLRGQNKQSVERLGRALAECDHWPCNPGFETSAHGAMAWYLLVDPERDGEDLEAVGDHLTAQLEGAEASPSETANILINRAFWHRRSGRDPGPTLGQAQEWLRSEEPGPRVASLQAWAEIVAGLWALDAGSSLEAESHCQRAVGWASSRSDDSDGLAEPLSQDLAWAWSCLGQARRGESNAKGALQAFEQALVYHALVSPDSPAGLPMVPGQRVDDYYRAARAAVEMGEPRYAWRLLEALDLQAAESYAGCRDQQIVKAPDLESRRQDLLERLAWTEPPLAPGRSQQLGPVRWSLLQALEDLHRTLLVTCVGSSGADRLPAQVGSQPRVPPFLRSTVPADYRGFALPEEVLLLARKADGQIDVHRTKWPRPELRRVLQEVARVQGVGRVADRGSGPVDLDGDNQAWRALVQTLAKALVPQNFGSAVSLPLGEVTRYALHGPLQAVPLGALPVRVDGEDRWLGELTTAVLHPPWVVGKLPGKLSGKHSGEPWMGTGRPLFVIDPTLTLPSSRIQGDWFRQLYPKASCLVGSAATRSAVTEALATASFVHIDSHGSFDAAFPTLSGLELHDGRLTLGDFLSSGLPRGLVNLSGCFTGSGAASGDSGLYGLAGLLAQRGVGWVVASHSAASDRLLADFNQGFYQSLTAGGGIPAAYGLAMGPLRETYPAASWSNLVLVGSGSSGQGAKRFTSGL